MKKLISVIMVIFIIITMCGCGARPISKNDFANDGYYIYPVAIRGEKQLIYDTETKIVYISQSTYSGFPIYTPYFSENGFLCKFINGELVEVIN